MNDGIVVIVLAAAVAYGTPLLFAALGELLAERSGVLNLGVEGMMLMGAVIGFLCVQHVGGSAGVALPIAVGAAAVAGGGCALILAFLVVTLRANQIVSGLALTIFAGAAGLYVFLGADFVAAVQLLIYVGGILVLILFAVMLTHRITDVEITNRAAGRIPALLITGVFIYILVQTIRETPWVRVKEIVHQPTTAKIGDLFLDSYLLPFELASLVLLAALIGAVVISRKEIKE